MKRRIVASIEDDPEAIEARVMANLDHGMILNEVLFTWMTEEEKDKVMKWLFDTYELADIYK